MRKSARLELPGRVAARRAGCRLWLGTLAVFTLAGCGGAGSSPASSGSAAGEAPVFAAAARVDSVLPEHPDADGATLDILGTGLSGSWVATLTDAATGHVAELGPLVAEDQDTRLRVRTPPLAGVGPVVRAQLVVRRAPGMPALTVDSAILERNIEFRRTWRAIDGSGNHVEQPTLNTPGTALARRLPSAYADGLQALAGMTRPNPRTVSNAVCAQLADEPNAAGASDMLWQWGQFLDHDLDLTPEADPAEPAFVLVPSGDVAFDPFGSGTVVLPFLRSAWVVGMAPREQQQTITGWIDASNVYGSDATRAQALRTLDGTGRLRVSAGNLLPYNTQGLPNAGGSDASLFLAGDVRANEQVGLTTLHTLFVREHNRWVGLLATRHPGLDGDALYAEARRRVAALMQVITYEEFLPLLLGREALSPWSGYDASVDARIGNAFSTAAFRLGHSLLSPTLLRLDEDGAESLQGHLSLRDAFFTPERLAQEGGIEPVLRGLCAQAAQELDTHIVDDVRDFLFGPPGAGGLDLAALNLQRGRDHGLPSYTIARAALGLQPPMSFAEIARDATTAAGLAAVYADPAEVDLWVGALAEAPVEGAMVGPTLRRILADQFQRLRDGDRYWFEGRLDEQTVRELRTTRLSDVIRRNTTIVAGIDDDVFRVGQQAGPRPPARPTLPGPRAVARLRAWAAEGAR